MKKILSRLPGINSSHKIVRILSYPLYGFLSLIILAIVIPVAPSLEVYANSPTNSLSPEIKGVTRASTAVYLLQNDKTILTTKADSSGEYAFHLGNIPEGNHSYTIESCDKEGREHCTSQLTTLYIDRTAPTLPTLAEIPTNIEVESLIISGETEQGAEVIVTNGDREYKTVTTDQGNFSIEIPDLQEGDNELITTVVDQAGNRSQPISVITNLTIPESQKLFKVIKVVDGDTITLEDGRTLRYIGIDTPETVDPRKPIQCYGQEASNKNKELLDNKEVRLEKDISETDKYGRTLRYIYVGDIFVNDYLVREGYARASSYPPDIKYQDQFQQAEQEARDNKRGLWGDACAIPTPTPSAPKEPNTNSLTPASVIPTPQPTTTTTQVTPATTPMGSCSGPDKDCGDFATHAQAQAFFVSCGGPGADPHKLDRDGDGLACESLP